MIDERMWRSVVDMSIDRLTFCGNVFGSLELFIENNEYIKRKGFAKYPYRDTIHFIDGSVLQIAELEVVRAGRIKQLRYEFNPNNGMYDKVHMSVMKLMKDIHMTRCDIAMDVRGVDMSGWKWFDRLSRPQQHYVSGTGKMETVYIGGKHSELVLRIYDKAKEQYNKMKGVRGKTDELKEFVADRKKDLWWRVEVQLRGEWAEHFRLWSRQGAPPMNPFDDVAPLLMNTSKIRELPIKERAMVKELLMEPSSWDELSKATRAKYKKMIRELDEKESKKVIDLKSLWNEKSSDVASELQTWCSWAK